jgi:hypothetical protein
MSLKKMYLIGWLCLMGLWACETKPQNEQTSVAVDTSLSVTPPTKPDAEQTQESVATDTVVQDTVTALPTPAPAEPSAMLLQKIFEGEIEGFKSRIYTFALAQDAQVSIRVRDKKQAVFKLYRQTGELVETIVKEDVHYWKGELEAGDYELKVFLPLKQAAKKKRSAFQIDVVAQRL